MLTRQELKQNAKQQLQGKIGIIFLCGVIYFAITLGLNFIPLLGSIAVLLLTPALELGFTKLYMDISYGRNAEVGTLFSGFSQFGQAILTYLLIAGLSLLVSVVILLPFVVLLVVGIELGSTGIVLGAAAWYFVAMILLIYFTLGLIFVFYIMAENPDLSALDLLKASWSMMKGHRFEYIILTLSFIPWILLGAITLGIGYIWVVPYMSLTTVNFYHNLKPDGADSDEYGYREYNSSEAYEAYGSEENTQE